MNLKLCTLVRLDTLHVPPATAVSGYCAGQLMTTDHFRPAQSALDSIAVIHSLKVQFWSQKEAWTSAPSSVILDKTLIAL